MASASSTPYNQEEWGNMPKSHFQQAVCLADWWLIKAENDFQGSRLGVAGLSSRERHAMRVFSSAPISKRYDVFTLETSDGIFVILKGLMNKARTLENGFPSDACSHFVFGFPPYWKDYGEKFISKESSCGNILGLNLHKKLSLGGQLYDDRHENDLGSQDGMSTKDVWNNEKTINMATPFLQTSDPALSEENLNRGHEKKSYSEVPTFEDQHGLIMQIETKISEVNDKDVDDSHINDSAGILAPSRLRDSSRSKMAGMVVGLGNKNVKANIDGKATLLEDMIDETKGGMRECAMQTSKRKQKSDKKTARISRVEMARLNSLPTMGDDKVEPASVDCVPESRNRWNSEGSGLRSHTVQRNLIDAGPIKDAFEQTYETPKQNEDHKTTKTKGNYKQREKSKATRVLSAGAAAENLKQKVTVDKSSLSENAGASGTETRQMAYETPDIRKEKVCSASTEFLGFTRSRSGRLLMPSLEFWRNQRAIYDVDRTVTEIQESTQLAGRANKPGRAKKRKRT